MRMIMLLLAALGLSQSAAAPIRSGQFLDELVVKDIDVRDGRNFELVNSFSYKDPKGVVWLVPKGFVSDGASIPQPLWSFVGGPWDGPYRRPAVIHDYFFRERRYASAEVHRVFYDAMLTAGVAALKAKLMYWAVLRFNDEWGSSSGLPSCGTQEPRRFRCIVLPLDQRPAASQLALIHVAWNADEFREAEVQINKNDPPTEELERDAVAHRKKAASENK